MTCGVYALNVDFGRYVGSSVDIEKRYSTHQTTLKQGIHHCAMRESQQMRRTMEAAA